jgi:endonuclease YncB( thermonuclease family)
LYSQNKTLKVANQNNIIEYSELDIKEHTNIVMKFFESTWNVSGVEMQQNIHNPGTPEVLDGDTLRVMNAKNIKVYKKQ